MGRTLVHMMRIPLSWLVLVALAVMMLLAAEQSGSSTPRPAPLTGAVSSANTSVAESASSTEAAKKTPKPCKPAKPGKKPKNCEISAG